MRRLNRFQFCILFFIVIFLIPPSNAQTYDIEDYFILTPGSCWHYRNVVSSTLDDAFTWTVLPDTIAAHGVQATQIETKTDELTDDRNCDRDYWSIDANGNLFFHGISNAEADGSGPTQFPAGDYIFDSPFQAGSRNMTAGQTFSDTVSISSGLPFPINSATIILSLEFVGIVPVYDTYLGNFSNVMHLRISISAGSIETQLGTIPVNIPLRQSEVFLAEGIGMIAQDQNFDPNDAEVQAIDGGKVAGSIIPCSNAPDVFFFFL